jgi:iron(II)-dependent oxidoreductase
MRRYLPKLPLSVWLLLAVPVALLFAWLSGHWTLGAAIVASVLCLLALRQPQLQVSPWQRLGRHEVEPVEYRPSQPEARRPVRRSTKGGSLVEQMISLGRAALLLRPQIASGLSASDMAAAEAALDDDMAIVPQGPVAVRGRCYDGSDDESTSSKAERLVQVDGFFLDRFLVSNQLYQLFVEEGGYEQMSLWDESIWPAVLSFVDKTGNPGPRYWENGRYPRGKEDHPVVGVSWYEASAYARWAGKRLPTDPEWVKSGTWPIFAESNKPVQRKFPWGDAMDRRRVNLWGSGHDATVSVYSQPDSAGVNGVQQLVGNVWEWTSSTFGAWEPANRKIETYLPLKSIRGGAFDTYFDAQAQCQFQSGEAPLARKHNIGFRCALGFCDVVHMADAADADATDELPGAPAPEEALA